MRDFNSGNLKIHFKLGTPAELIWTGKSDAREPRLELTPYFEDAVKELADRGVVIDFCQLEYMNSSTVRPIITFIQALDKASVKTVIKYDPSITFQKTSFAAVSTLSKMLVNVSVVPV